MSDYNAIPCRIDFHQVIPENFDAIHLGSFILITPSLAEEMKAHDQKTAFREIKFAPTKFKYNERLQN